MDGRVDIVLGLLGVTVSYVELGGRLEVWVVMGNCHIPVIWVVEEGSEQRRIY